MADNILLVDIFDNEIGYAEKIEAHRKEQLHRAFSVFIYNGDKMLVQRRHPNKYHSGGLIANSCCSHQRQGESLHESVERRLGEELGIKTELNELFSFIYYKKFENGLAEYEFDHVFVGEYKGKITADPEEIAEAFWVSLDELAHDLAQNPQKYAAWFITAAPRVIAELKAAKK